MPAFSSKTASDGTISRVYGPDRIDPKTNEAMHVNRASGIAVGYDILSIQVIKAKGRYPVDRVRVTLVQPTLAVTSPTTGSGIQPNPTKAYEHRAVVEFFMPVVGTLAERTALETSLRNVLAIADVLTTVRTLESMY